jgi:hypothetical protein
MKTRPWGNSGIRVEAWTYGERPRRRVPVCHPPAGAVGQALSGAKRKQRNTGGGVMDGRQATPRSPGHLTDGERDREPKRAIGKKICSRRWQRGNPGAQEDDQGLSNADYSHRARLDLGPAPHWNREEPAMVSGADSLGGDGGRARDSQLGRGALPGGLDFLEEPALRFALNARPTASQGFAAGGLLQKMAGAVFGNQIPQ